VGDDSMKEIVLKLKDSIEISDILCYSASYGTRHNPSGTARSNRLAKAITKKYPQRIYKYKQNFTELTITLIKRTMEEQSVYIKREENRLIEFASIDSREGRYGVLYTDFDGIPTSNNYPVLIEAEHEYLMRLDELQQSIRKKYEPKLIASADDRELTDDEIDDIESKAYSSELSHLYYT
jgi:hypothetical protein